VDSNLLIALGLAAVGILAAVFAFGLLPGDDDLHWRGKDLRDLETGDHRKPRKKSLLRRLVDGILRRKDD
jgi:hypothetical protein